jgi:hypothetical protein
MNGALGDVELPGYRLAGVQWLATAFVIFDKSAQGPFVSTGGSLSLLRLCCQHRLGLSGHHSSLSCCQVPSLQVKAKHPRSGRSLSAPLLKPWLNAGFQAGQIPIPAVQYESLVQDDGIV